MLEHGKDRGVWSLVSAALMSLQGCNWEGAGPDNYKAFDSVQTPVREEVDDGRRDITRPVSGTCSLYEAPSLKLPTFLLPFLINNSEPELREALTFCVHRELSREERSTPAVMVRELNESLLSAGVSNEEAQRFLAVFLEWSPFPLREMHHYWLTLQELYPESESIKQQVEAFAGFDRPLPPGGLSVCFDSSAGTLSEQMNTLWDARRAREDSSWIPTSLDELPVNVSVGAESFVVEEGLIEPNDVLKFDGKMTATSRKSGQVLWTRPLSVAFSPMVPGARHNHDLPLQGSELLTGEEFVVKLTYTVLHLASDGTPKSGIFENTQLRSFKPVYSSEQQPLGYLVEPLGLDGHPLRQPSATYAVFDTYRLALTLQRDGIRELAKKEGEKERRQAALLGASLDRISLAHSAAGNVDVLRLRQDTPTIITFGATWCGPCRNLAPGVNELSRLLKEQKEQGAEVLKFSIDDDANNYVSELASYPNGVVTPEQWAETGLPGVPAYIVVESGRVTESGILSAAKLAEFKTRFAGATSANNP